MLKKIYLSIGVAALMSLSACSSIDYQSLSQCSSSAGSYKAPAENDTAPHGTIESIHIGSYGMENWHGIVTHVDCHAVNDPWEIIRLPAGEHTVRVRFNGHGDTVDFAIKPTSFDESAQLLRLDVKPGKKYTLHIKTLVMWDMAFWIMSEGQVVAATPNFKPSFAK